MSHSSSPLPVIGFIGTGVMGASMAGHVLHAGYPLHVTTRTKSKAQPLLDAGAVWADSPAALAEACDMVFTIVGFPRDVEEVYFGQHGLLSALRPDTVLVDMTTSSPELAVRIAEAARAKSSHALDAPVSGGDKGAREGTLSIMVGGEPEVFARIEPLFNLMGKQIVLQGPAGSGQHCKLCNQILVAAGMVGVCEALAYAEHAGLDPRTVLKSVASGAAGSWALSNLGPRILDGDFEPGFYVKHFIKDLTLAVEAAGKTGLDVPGLKLTLNLYRELADSGAADQGTQALIQKYR
jgi:3-hydroxyisobutyrate dehydrogenase